MSDFQKIVESIFKGMPVTVLSVTPNSSSLNVILSVPEDMKEREEFVQVYQREIEARCGVEQASILLTSHKNKPTPQPLTKPPNVKKVIGVASGKGGVGKSTVATGLALSLKKLNLNVGIVDGDVHGPSIPRIMNMRKKPSVEGGQFIPESAQGVQCISIGVLVDSPAIWRGPMTSSAVEKLIHKTKWKELDILIIDFPPGTGDVPLSLCTRLDMSGVVLVSTPDPIAVDDVEKAFHMFRKLDTKILGIVENMSIVKCPKCGETIELFSGGAMKNFIQKEKIETLGNIPFATKEERETEFDLISKRVKSALFP